MHPRFPFIKAVAVLTLLFSVIKAVPPAVQDDVIPIVARPATLDDVAHTFTSDFKLSSSCPDKIEIMAMPKIYKEKIGEVNASDVKEDDQECRGTESSAFTFVPEKMATSGKLLAEMGYLSTYLALKKSPAATFLKEEKGDNSSLLIGFIEGGRKCGKLNYSEDALWFFSNMPEKAAVRVPTATKGHSKDVNIPPNTRALIVIDGYFKICVFTDKSTTQGKKIWITEVKSSPSPSTIRTSSPSNSATYKDKGAEKNLTAVKVPTDAGEAENLEASPIVSFEAGESVCFPAHALVELENGIGSFVSIADLRIGDRVHTGKDTFSDVFMFTHRDANVRSGFVHLGTSSGANITLTPSHYLYSNGNHVAAGAVYIGDELALGNGTFSKVKWVKMVVAKGLYNPHSLDGKIVVDGIITSTYTTTVHPMLAHVGLLAPIRAAYHLGVKWNVLDTIGPFVGYYGDKLSRFVPCGPASMEQYKYTGRRR